MMEQYLHAAIRDENTSGSEFFLASIIQDAVIHECFETEDTENLKEMAHRTACFALNVVHESMGINSFIVCETIRGVVHGLVALGGEPSIIIREAIRGICMESCKYEFPLDKVCSGIKVGIQMSAQDLGIKENELLDMVDVGISTSFLNACGEES